MGKDQHCDPRSAVTRTERQPHHSSCLGSSQSVRVLWENRYLVFMNSHRRFFFSSTSCSVLWCVKRTSPSSGALVPTETKTRPFGLFFCFVLFCFFLLYWVCFLYGHFSIWDKWGLLSACRVHGFSLQWLLLLWSTGFRHMGFSSFAIGSVSVLHQLSCSLACEIFPEQGLKPCLPHRQANFLPWGHQGVRAIK